MWTMHDAPSDRDYAEQQNPQDDEMECPVCDCNPCRCLEEAAEDDD